MPSLNEFAYLLACEEIFKLIRDARALSGASQAGCYTGIIMAKFVYSMQNILNLNEKLEDQAKMAYASQQAVVNEEEEKEQRLRDRKAAYEDEARRIREDSVNVKEMMLNANAISIMGELINEQHGVVLKEEEVLEVRRAALEEAMKDRKTQEKLKEKAFDVFKQELAMEESKEIDQLTSYTFGIRKQKNNG